MDSRDFDVIVVGGGPGGSACSTMLARHDLRILLIDRAKFPRDKICGDCVHPDSWRFFDVLGISDRLRRKELRTISSVRITSMHGKEVVTRIPSDPSKPLFAVRRKVLDEVLLDNARLAGVTFIQEGKILDIAHPEMWEVTVQSPTACESFRAPYLVGADGRNSFVAGKINAQTWSYSPLKSSNRVGVQWHARFQTNIGAEIRMYKFESGYGGVVNVDNQTANIAMVTIPSTARLAVSDFPRFLEWTMLGNSHCAQSCDNLNPLEHISTAYPINPLLRRSRRPDAFLVGDARRTVEPFTGEGIRFALQDGVLTAARILKLVGKKSSAIRLSARSPLWVNGFYSPILRNHRMSEFLISLAARRPWIPQLLNNIMFRPLQRASQSG